MILKLRHAVTRLACLYDNNNVILLNILAVVFPPALLRADRPLAFLLSSLRLLLLAASRLQLAFQPVDAAEVQLRAILQKMHEP